MGHGSSSLTRRVAGRPTDVGGGDVDAAGFPATISKPTTAYQWPTKDSPAVITGLAKDQQVTAHCFAEGDVVDGNQYWFRISLTPDPQGNTGFVHRGAISDVS